MKETVTLSVAGTGPREPAAQGEAPGSKDAHINLRIAATDKRAIEKKAGQAGLKTGEFIRRAALGKVVVERIPPDLRQEISLVGNNLNRLVGLASAGKLPGVGVAQLADLVNRLLQTLR